MTREDNLYLLADVFKIFGDGTRIRILYALLSKELCVHQISGELNMTQSAISHQLRLLKSHRLVKARRDGKSMIYSLDDEHVASILFQGLRHVEENEICK